MNYTNINLKRANFEFKGMYLNIETGIAENNLTCEKDFENVISLVPFLKEEFSKNVNLYLFLQEHIHIILPFITKQYGRRDLIELFKNADIGFYQALNNYLPSIDSDKREILDNLLLDFTDFYDWLKYPLWNLYFRFPEYLTDLEIKGIIEKTENLQELYHLLHPTHLRPDVARQYAHLITHKFLLLEEKGDNSLSSSEFKYLRKVLGDIVWKNPLISPTQRFKVISIFNTTESSFYHHSMIHLGSKELFSTFNGLLKEGLFKYLVDQNFGSQVFMKKAIEKLMDISVTERCETKDFEIAFKAVLKKAFLNAENILLIEEFVKGNERLKKLAAENHQYFRKDLKKSID